MAGPRWISDAGKLCTQVQAARHICPCTCSKEILSRITINSYSWTHNCGTVSYRLLPARLFSLACAGLCSPGSFSAWWSVFACSVILVYLRATLPAISFQLKEHFVYYTRSRSRVVLETWCAKRKSWKIWPCPYHCTIRTDRKFKYAKTAAKIFSAYYPMFCMEIIVRAKM